MKGRREKKSAKNINDHVVLGAWTLARVSKQSCVAFVHSIQEITRVHHPPVVRGFCSTLHYADRDFHLREYVSAACLL